MQHDIIFILYTDTKMKKNLLIASIAGVTALTGIAALIWTSSAQAANETLSTSSARTKLQNVMKKRQKVANGTSQELPGSWSGAMQGQWHGKRWGEKGGLWFGMWGPGMWEHFAENSDITKAFAANDYNAFVTALKADTNRPTDAKTPTQEEFTKMVAQYAKHQARQAAIDANDYDAFVKATTPTKDEFTQIVAKNTQHKAIKTAIDNKDYNAFVAALKADTNRPADAEIPTQEEFTKMLEKKAEKQQTTQTANK